MKTTSVRDGVFTVVGNKVRVTASNRILIGASGTYEVTLTKDGFKAPNCSKLNLSSLLSLKINASELLPYEMDNTEITIMSFDTISPDGIT